MEMFSVFIPNQVYLIIPLAENENLLELFIANDDVAVHVYYIWSDFKFHILKKLRHYGIKS